MSNSKQKFVELVYDIFSVFLAEFNLFPVESDWPDTVRYSSDSITLDFYFGPPEFRVEVFFVTSQTSVTRTYALVDLFKKKSIKNWVYENKLIMKSDDKLKQELNWHYSFLQNCCIDALKGDRNFFADL